MTIMNVTPTYNLKVIVAETGLKPDTLRAWERRYGLPKPKRSEGRHRLYSQHDLEIIKWLMARQAEGLSISRAVKLWRQMESEGQNPLAVYRETLPVETAVTPIAGTRIEDLRDSWIQAIYSFNEIEAEQALAQAFALYPPETVCLQVLMQGLSTIGNQWYIGEATVQQEHFASALAMRRLHTLIAAAPPPTRRERIIVACPPLEDHAFAPLLLSLLMRYRGWDVVYLGVDVPIDRLETTLNNIRPDLVLMSAQQLHTAASLLEVAQFLQKQKMPMAYGGLIFNLISDLHTCIPAHFLGKRLQDAPHLIENLVNFQPPPPDVDPPAESYRVTLDQYTQRQSQIEAHMWQKFQENDISYRHFVNANQYMSQVVLAALKLGDMDYIGTELEWIRQLLVNLDWPSAALRGYLLAYHQAVDVNLGDRGLPITLWLEQIVQT